MYVYDAPLITHRFSTLCTYCMQKCTKTLFKIRKKKQYYIKMKYMRQNGNKCFKEYISEILVNLCIKKEF